LESYAVMLSEPDIERLTEKKQPGAQCEALRLLGLSFGITLSGRPIVTQAALDLWVMGKAAKTKTATIKAGVFDA